jgi:hypothetical protein
MDDDIWTDYTDDDAIAWLTEGEAAPAPPRAALTAPTETEAALAALQVVPPLLGTIPALLEALVRTTAPHAAGRPAGFEAAERAPAWIGYTPGSPNTLLIGQRELPAPAGVPMRNWAAPDVGQFTSKSTRALSDVRQIVIHETVSHVWQGIKDPTLGVQFHLDRDGTLIQHNDVLDMLWHVKTFSPNSVGIETVNLVFDADALADPGEPKPGDRIPIRWGGKQGAYYVVPPAAQMEALAQTVDALRLHLAVPDTWLQVMAHPDPGRAAGDMRGRTFFLLTTAGHQYFTTATAQPWIASHSVLRDHEDGAFPTLYCYLRLHKAMAPADAYQMATQIVEDPDGRRLHTHYDKATNAQLQLLDITDVA